MIPIVEHRRIRQAAAALLLALAGNSALADNDVDAETTIRLMDAAEANSAFAVTQDIALPQNARIDAESHRRGKSAAANGKDRGNRGQRDRRDRDDRGRSRADEARDNARDMSDNARENRENRGRSGDRPDRGRPDRPDPPKGPKDK
jgi:hypothetical protein